MIRTLFTAVGLAASAAGALAQQPDPIPPPTPVQPKTDLSKLPPPKVDPPKAVTPKTDTPIEPKGTPLPLPGGTLTTLPPGLAPAAEPVRTFADYPPSYLPPGGYYGYGTLPPRIPFGPSVSPLEYPYPLYSTPPGAAWPQHTPLAPPHGVYGRRGRW